MNGQTYFVKKNQLGKGNKINKNKNSLVPLSALKTPPSIHFLWSCKRNVSVSDLPGTSDSLLHWIWDSSMEEFTRVLSEQQPACRSEQFCKHPIITAKQTRAWKGSNVDGWYFSIYCSLKLGLLKVLILHLYPLYECSEKFVTLENVLNEKQSPKSFQRCPT